MATRLQLRKGTTTEHSTFVGANGEVTVDTTKKALVLHDGVTAGGFPVAARANADGTISLIKKDGTIIASINATGLFNNTLTSTATDQALTAAQGKVLNDQAFGVGQSWGDSTGLIISGTTYTNTSLKTIFIIAVSGKSSSTSTIRITINGVDLPLIGGDQDDGGASVGVFLPVPPGSTYKLTGTPSILGAWVLR